MQISTFAIPPSGDILLLGTRCPIGLEAGKKMLAIVAPDQFESIDIDDDVVEAFFVKKYLLLRTDRDAFVKMVLEESKMVMSKDCMLTIKCKISVEIEREI